jgi:hypothetical protein
MKNPNEFSHWAFLFSHLLLEQILPLIEKKSPDIKWPFLVCFCLLFLVYKYSCNENLPFFSFITYLH